MVLVVSVVLVVGMVFISVTSHAEASLREGSHLPPGMVPAAEGGSGDSHGNLAVVNLPGQIGSKYFYANLAFRSLSDKSRNIYKETNV